MYDYCMEDYYSRPELSHSQLKEIRNSPAHFQHYLSRPPSQTDAMLLGSLVHTMVLEPQEVDTRFVAAPKIDRRTKKGKDEWSALQSTTGQRQLIPMPVWTQASQMRDSVIANRDAESRLVVARIEKSVEREFYWTDRRGFDRRAKLDAVCSDGTVIDLKTTISAGRGFNRSIFKYAYHTQAAYYADAARSSGIDFTSFMFVCIEKRPPYATAVYRLSPKWLECGRATLEKWLDEYEECSRLNYWPAYPRGVRTLEPPDWAIEENALDNAEDE